MNAQDEIVEKIKSGKLKTKRVYDDCTLACGLLSVGVNNADNILYDVVANKHNLICGYVNSSPDCKTGYMITPGQEFGCKYMFSFYEGESHADVHITFRKCLFGDELFDEIMI